MGWVSAIVSILLAIFRGIFGTDKPLKTTVEHAEPDAEITDGKSDDDRLDDLGL
ncbi:MAG: hypothetical protein JXR97_16925 [Planctomycetes bacterium]|nr:hypothetical protein [Planctomycetota bacterium]